MTPEERELLNKSVELAQENNQILHAIRRSLRLQRVMSILYWVFIIGSAVGAYYLLQPYLEQLMGIYSSAGNVLENFQP